MGNVYSFDRTAQRDVKGSSLRRKAAAVSAALSALFLIVYGTCNWVTAHRMDVGSLYFNWEHAIPFVPFLVPAYLSLDLFFIGAPFLCRSDEELRAYTKRISAAILIAGVCFLLFPLRFAFGRPDAGKAFGLVFDWFRSVDPPYNLFPSLHAALLLLVAGVYVQNLRGSVRAAAISWFILIGVSPVLTYQHHLVDIVGGIILAVGCFYFLPARPDPLPVTIDRADSGATVRHG
jgi:membrane-associated phospholipid phosphatase